MKSIISSLKHWSALFVIVIITCLTACDEDDPALPDNLVGFESEALGFDADENTLTVKINLSREATEDVTITVTSVLTGLTYNNEFTTDPAMTGNNLVLTVPKGSMQASFSIIKNEDVLFDGDESISFTINSVGENLVIGEGSVIVVSFSEILATQGTMNPAVGGQLQPNKVFIDLSASRQTYFNRSDWDLGFYTADGQFRVILNSSSSAMARVIDKTDLNTVSASDTLGWSTQLSADAIFAAITSDPVPAWTSASSSWIDAPSGDMSATAIAAISTTDADNKVYIVNRGKNPDGSQRGWKKIRILRKGSNYTLQHADIAAGTFTTVEVTRDADYLFNYVKFEHGIVDTEPKKDKWDIAFTVFTNTTPAGPGLTVPYVFSDIVIQNRYNTETAELLIANAGAYNDFDEDDLSVATFSTTQLNIGSKWRSGGGPGGGPALRQDRFYLVKDSAGNIYKLKFTALTQNGERGRPQIQFALIKKG